MFVFVFHAPRESWGQSWSQAQACVLVCVARCGSRILFWAAFFVCVCVYALVDARHCVTKELEGKQSTGTHACVCVCPGVDCCEHGLNKR